MQDKYVGDIGDYGKYGLLRAIVPTDSKLGIVWYLVPDENHLNDGRYVDYLSNLKYIDCDRELFLILKKIITSGKRNISQVEQSDIFPAHTIYYSDCLSYDGIRAGTPKERLNRILKREQWINKALQITSDCDAVFLDPDNGLETPSVLKHATKAHKYVYYDEVRRLLPNVDTLIIYHHLNRNGNHITQIKARMKVLGELSGDCYDVISLRFKTYSPRAYFVITNQEHVRGKIKELFNSNWKQCFELVK